MDDFGVLSYKRSGKLRRWRSPQCRAKLIEMKQVLGFEQDNVSKLRNQGDGKIVLL